MDLQIIDNCKALWYSPLIIGT